MGGFPSFTETVGGGDSSGALAQESDATADVDDGRGRKSIFRYRERRESGEGGAWSVVEDSMENLTKRFLFI